MIGTNESWGANFRPSNAAALGLVNEEDFETEVRKMMNLLRTKHLIVNGKEGEVEEEIRRISALPQQSKGAAPKLARQVYVILWNEFRADEDREGSSKALDGQDLLMKFKQWRRKRFPDHFQLFKLFLQSGEELCFTRRKKDSFANQNGVFFYPTVLLSELMGTSTLAQYIVRSAENDPLQMAVAKKVGTISTPAPMSEQTKKRARKEDEMGALTPPKYPALAPTKATTESSTRVQKNNSNSESKKQTIPTPQKSPSNADKRTQEFIAEKSKKPSKTVSPESVGKKDTEKISENKKTTTTPPKSETKHVLEKPQLSKNEEFVPPILKESEIEKKDNSVDVGRKRKNISNNDTEKITAPKKKNKVESGLNTQEIAKPKKKKKKKVVKAKSVTNGVTTAPSTIWESIYNTLASFWRK